MKRTLVALLAIVAAVALVALFAWAQTPTTYTDVTVDDDLIVTDDATIGGDLAVTGGITATGGVAGALNGSAAGALGNFTVVEADTLKPGSGTAFNLRAKDGHDDADLNVYGVSVSDVDATIANVDTLKPGSGTAFHLRAADGHNDADLNCADFSGNLTGDVTGNLTGNVSGNTSTLFQAVTYQGNLPTAGDNTGEFFKNTVGDSGWVADNDSWVQLWP
jgi:hypothetical protein